MGAASEAVGTVPPAALCVLTALDVENCVAEAEAVLVSNAPCVPEGESVSV